MVRYINKNWNQTNFIYIIFGVWFSLGIVRFCSRCLLVEKKTDSFTHKRAHTVHKYSCIRSHIWPTHGKPTFVVQYIGTCANANSKEYNTNTFGNVGRICAQKASYAIRLNFTHTHTIYTFGELKRMEENQEIQGTNSSNHILWIIAIEKKMNKIFFFSIYWVYSVCISCSCIGDIYIFGLLVVHMTNVTARKTLIAFIYHSKLFRSLFSICLLFSLCFCTIFQYFLAIQLFIQPQSCHYMIISTFCCCRCFGHWSAAVCHQSYPKNVISIFMSKMIELHNCNQFDQSLFRNSVCVYTVECVIVCTTLSVTLA